jgi:DNA-binding transcriptional LysR family regulator
MVAERHFQDVGFSPRIAMSLGSNEAIKHSVAAGLGVAVISSLAVQSGSAGVAILDVARFPLDRSWSVVWRSDRAMTAAARRFVSHLRGQQGLEGAVG